MSLGHPRGQHRRVDAGLLQTPELVCHQRDQWADDHDEPLAGERGQLIAERLAPAGGHHDEAVAPFERRLHRLALAGPEGLQTKALEQLLGSEQLLGG